jgi:hypothetical protein
MHAFQFSVSLRFFSLIITPSEISEHLGLKPKWAHEKGAPRTTPKGVILGGVYDRSYCSFSLIRQGDEELHEMLSRVADEFFQKKDFFHQVRESNGRSELFIGWYSSGNTGDCFNHVLLSKLGELGIDLALDVYG